MSDPLPDLLLLARYLGQRHPLEEVLAELTLRAAAIVGAHRVSVRVLDPARENLVAVARAGVAVHADPAPFSVGDGLVGWVAAHEAPLRLGDAEADPRFALRDGARVHIGSFLGVPLVAGEGCLGVLAFVAEERDAFDERQEELALLVSAVCAPHLEVARLAKLTHLDALTGLLNRRALDAELGTTRLDPTSVILCDIDHFKAINDAHGHAVGDRVLRAVAEVLAAVVRRADPVARYGGEEFVLLLRGATRSAATAIAERGRERVAALRVPIAGGSVTVAASFGVAQLLEGELLGHALVRADAAMYEAKRLGRDRVVTDMTGSERPPPGRGSWRPPHA